MKKYYTIYDNKTDEIIAFGSANQCIEKMKLKNRNTFFSMVSNVRTGKIKKYKIIVDDDEE